jgi:hypothetical protein
MYVTAKGQICEYLLEKSPQTTFQSASVVELIQSDHEEMNSVHVSSFEKYFLQCAIFFSTCQIQSVQIAFPLV